MGSHNSLCAAAPRQKLQINFSVSPSHSTLTPVPAMPLLRLAGLPLECQVLSHWYDSTCKTPMALVPTYKLSGIRTQGSAALEADVFTTGPTRWSLGQPSSVTVCTSGCQTHVRSAIAYSYLSASPARSTGFTLLKTKQQIMSNDIDDGFLTRCNRQRHPNSII